MRIITYAALFFSLFTALQVSANSMDSHHEHDAEHMAVMSLVQEQFVTHQSQQDGDWSNPETWGGMLPTEGARVQISTNHSVVVDEPIEETIRTLRIDGTLRFKEQAETKLIAETIVVTTNGSLEIGSQHQPITQSAEIIFVDVDNNGFETQDVSSPDFDPYKLGIGLIVMGNFDVHGKAKSGYTTFDEAHVGDSILHVDSVPEGWVVGDKIGIAGTSRGNEESDAEQHELRTIVNLTEQSIELDSPLLYDRFLPRHHKDGLTLKLHVINLSRNVTFSTHSDGRDTYLTHSDSRKKEYTQRGHLMFMHSAAVDFRYAALHYLGRTNKRWTAGTTTHNEDGSYNISTNPLARYPLHFHMAYAEKLGVIVGNAVLNSPGFGFVNHSSYVRFRDNVTYDVFGSAYVAELGDELGSFVGNVAMRTYGTKTSGLNRLGGQTIFDRGHRGESFWTQSRLIHFEDNIAIGFAWAGYAGWLEFHFDDSFYERQINARLVNNTRGEYDNLDTINVGTAVNSNTTPLYRNNLAYSGRLGWEDARIRAKTNGFVAHTIQVGQTRWYAGTSDHWDTTVLGDLENPVASEGVQAHGNSPSTTYTNLHVEGFEKGIEICSKGFCGVVNAYMNNVTDFSFNKQWNYGSPAYVVGDVRFGELSDSALAGRERNHFEVEFGYGSSGKSPFSPMVIDINDWNQAYQIHMKLEQSPGFIPYPSNGDRTPPVAEWADKDNLWFEQLWGAPIGGAWIPNSAIEVANTHNMLLEPITNLPVTPVAYFPTYEPLNIVNVSANTENQGRAAELAIDGDLDTKWVASLTDVNDEDIYFYIELDRQYYIDTLELSQNNSTVRNYFIDIDVSSDGINYTSIDRYLSSTEEVPFNAYYVGASGVKHLRLRMQGNNENQVWTNIQEVRVLGREYQY